MPESAVSRFLDLVTIGTIADVAPLIEENRILVRHGLPLLTLQNKKLGLSALLKAVGVQERASCGDVAFQIGPRLNAAGRVAHAAAALELLLTDRAGRSAREGGAALQRITPSDRKKSSARWSKRWRWWRH